jgi:hypothetical protein
VLSPRHTLIQPGIALAVLGAIGTVALAIGPISIGPVGLDVNALVYACAAVLVGTQLFLFGGFAEVYGRHEGIVPERRLDRWTRLFSLETCAAVGIGLIVLGVAGSVLAFSAWGAHGFGAQDARATLRVVLPSATVLATGVLVIFSGLFASLLTLRVGRFAPVPSEPVSPAPAPTRTAVGE